MVDHQIGMELLDERHAELRGVGAVQREAKKRDGDDESHHHLPEEFQFAGKTKVSATKDLVVIVRETDRGETEEREQSQQHVRIFQVRPEEHGHDGREHNQNTAHRGRAGLGLVTLRAFFADELADLQFAQAANGPRPEHEREHERRQAGHRGANRDVAKNV